MLGISREENPSIRHMDALGIKGKQVTFASKQLAALGVTRYALGITCCCHHITFFFNELHFSVMQ